jgi:acyl-CoA reductase-like NAD-dependent aldehyde dehydrogenase
MTNFNSDYSMTIGGKAATTKDTLPVYNPATRKVIAQVPSAGESDLNQAVAIAQDAFFSWSKTPLADRAKALNAIANVI